METVSTVRSGETRVDSSADMQEGWQLWDSGIYTCYMEGDVGEGPLPTLFRTNQLDHAPMAKLDSLSERGS